MTGRHFAEPGQGEEHLTERGQASTAFHREAARSAPLSAGVSSSPSSA